MYTSSSPPFPHTFLAIFHPAHVEHLSFPIHHIIHHLVFHTSIAFSQALYTNHSIFLITTICALVAINWVAEGRQAHTIEAVIAHKMKSSLVPFASNLDQEQYNSRLGKTSNLTIRVRDRRRIGTSIQHNHWHILEVVDNHQHHHIEVHHTTTRIEIIVRRSIDTTKWWSWTGKYRTLVVGFAHKTTTPNNTTVRVRFGSQVTATLQQSGTRSQRRTFGGRRITQQQEKDEQHPSKARGIASLSRLVWEKCSCNPGEGQSTEWEADIWSPKLPTCPTNEGRTASSKKRIES
jgi:hypothetical protein